jgi:NAD(P)-dependent dehydrogenase (short-subunit alcohol dehydrogenase family)
MQTIVITGVSTGIGLSAARTLSGRGWRVYGSVRTEADADRLRGALGGNFSPLIFDVTDEGAVRGAAERVRAELNGTSLAGLINNAGICVVGPVSHVPLSRWREQLDVNVLGVVTVTQAFLPLMQRERPRRGMIPCVINVSSVAGRLAMPYMGPYSASKFALEGLSDSLRRELMPFGIDVVLIEPGPVVTPIWDKAEARILADYPNTPYQKGLERFHRLAMDEAKTGYSAEVMAEAIARILKAGRRQARYVITPKRLTNWTIPRRLPAKFLDFCIGKVIGLT